MLQGIILSKLLYHCSSSDRKYRAVQKLNLALCRSAIHGNFVHDNLFLFSTIPLKHCKSKICYDLAVLSTLYREKMLNEKELEDLKKTDKCLDDLLVLQCIKTPDVGVRTAQVLEAVKHHEEANLLRG